MGPLELYSCTLTGDQPPLGTSEGWLRDAVELAAKRVEASDGDGRRALQRRGRPDAEAARRRAAPRGTSSYIRGISWSSR